MMSEKWNTLIKEGEKLYQQGEFSEGNVRLTLKDNSNCPVEPVVETIGFRYNIENHPL
jgi:hypothetical protein